MIVALEEARLALVNMRSDLKELGEQLKIELGKLESSLLDILGAADPNTILSNKELINSLDAKKKRAVEVEQKLVFRSCCGGSLMELDHMLVVTIHKVHLESLHSHI